MRGISLIIILSLVLFGCRSASEKKLEESIRSDAKFVEKKEFKILLEEENLEGSILIYNLKEDTYYSNDNEIAKHGYIPASTFKIPHTLIALDLGIIPDDEYIFEWDGTNYSVNNWNQDLSFRDAFHYSCVPCYQSIARQVGVDRMIAYLEKFDYRDMDVKADNIDMFWLEGDSKISPYDQIRFLEQFYFSRLPVSHRTYAISKKMMRVETDADYNLIAKTGRSLSGISWYIGIIEYEAELIFFATALEEQNFDHEKRNRITMKALESLLLI